MEKRSSEIPFLDVLVSIYSTKVPILINIYTLGHLILDMSNDLFQTICTIVSDEETRNQRLDELKKFLINQQYPYKLVEDGIKKASEVDREELINPKPRNEIIHRFYY